MQAVIFFFLYYYYPCKISSAPKEQLSPTPAGFTWSWEPVRSGGASVRDSVGLRRCSWYSGGIWDEADPALLFLGLSFCLWAQEVSCWLVLLHTQIRSGSARL